MTPPVREMFEAVRKLDSGQFEKMMEALNQYTYNNRFPSMFFLNVEQLRAIPKEVMVVLMAEDIPLVFDRLSDNLKSELDGYQRCVEHTTRYRGDVGPIVLKKDCIYCVNKHSTT